MDKGVDGSASCGGSGASGDVTVANASYTVTTAAEAASAAAAVASAAVAVAVAAAVSCDGCDAAHERDWGKLAVGKGRTGWLPEFAGEEADEVKAWLQTTVAHL